MTQENQCQVKASDKPITKPRIRFETRGSRIGNTAASFVGRALSSARHFLASADCAGSVVGDVSRYDTATVDETQQKIPRPQHTLWARDFYKPS